MPIWRNMQKNLHKVIAHIEKREPTKPKELSGDEAMEILKISSRTTLQKFRDEGKIRFSQPLGRVILYDRGSLYDFINRHVREPF